MATLELMTDRVLVVEDDHAVRSLLETLLQDEGLDVVTAASGPQALERFEGTRIDLVLLDIRLPGFDGFEVCRRLRRISSVPIIMVTAQHDSHDVVAGLELGADDYVTKPFNDGSCWLGSGPSSVGYRRRMGPRPRPSESESLRSGSVKVTFPRGPSVSL